jgi:excisionase family DNA binding protein
MATELDSAVYTVPEAARLLGISDRLYYAAAGRGEVPAVRIGRRLVVPGAQLRRLLEGGEAAPHREREMESDPRAAQGLPRHVRDRDVARKVAALVVNGNGKAADP